MSTKSQLIVTEDGVFRETCVVNRVRVMGLSEIIEKKVAESLENNYIVYPNIATDGGLRVNMGVWKNQVVFARRFSRDPIGLRVYRRGDNTIQIRRPEGVSEDQRVEAIFGPEAFTGMPSGVRPPEHWITFNIRTSKVTLVLYYNNAVFHPMLPNVHNHSEVCTGTSFNTDIEAWMAQCTNPTVFDKFRGAFHNVCRSPWNDDLRDYGFNRWRYNTTEGRLDPINVNQLTPVSHGDHVADLFK